MLKPLIAILSLMFLLFCSVSANASLIYQVQAVAASSSPYPAVNSNTDNHENDGTYRSYASVDDGFNNASAEADLTTGKLRTYTQSADLGSTSTDYYRSKTTANAAYFDTIIFDYTGDVVLEFLYEGTFTPGGNPTTDFRGYFTELAANDFFLISPTNDTPPGTYNAYGRYVENVVAGTTYRIGMGMSVSTYTGDYFNGLNTGSLNILMPTGQSFESGSGVLLSKTPDPIPEPATMLLIGTGLVGLAGTRLRRKK